MQNAMLQQNDVKVLNKVLNAMLFNNCSSSYYSKRPINHITCKQKSCCEESQGIILPKEEIQSKIRNILLFYDNFPSYKSLTVRPFFEKRKRSRILPYPPFSPDLHPPLFLFFSKYKQAPVRKMKCFKECFWMCNLSEQEYHSPNTLNECIQRLDKSAKIMSVC